MYQKASQQAALLDLVSVPMRILHTDLPRCRERDRALRAAAEASRLVDRGSSDASKQVARSAAEAKRLATEVQRLTSQCAQLDHTCR